MSYLWDTKRLQLCEASYTAVELQKIMLGCGEVRDLRASPSWRAGHQRCGAWISTRSHQHGTPLAWWPRELQQKASINVWLQPAPAGAILHCKALATSPSTSCKRSRKIHKGLFYIYFAPKNVIIIQTTSWFSIFSASIYVSRVFKGARWHQRRIYTIPTIKLSQRRMSVFSADLILLPD